MTLRRVLPTGGNLLEDEPAHRIRRTVRYLPSSFVSEDETCFHVHEGPSLRAIRVVSERAELSPIRIGEEQERQEAMEESR